jgi:hypothetical protein
MKHIGSLQDLNAALSEFDKKGLAHPGGPNIADSDQD